MISLLRLLYGTFPREVSVNHHKIIHCWDAFVDYINSVNGRVKMPAVSLYAYKDFFPENDKLDHSTAIINRLFYDFDIENTEGYNAIENAQKLDSELTKADWMHLWIMSGGGLHCYIFLEEIKYRFPSSTIMNFREFLQNSGFKFDSSVVAHTAQMCRIPGTWNLKRKLFATPITSKDLQTLDWDELKMFGKAYMHTYNDDITPYLTGTKKKTLQKFDMKRPGFDEPDEINIRFDSKEIIPVRPEDIKRECCKVPKDANNLQRFMIITYLIDQGFNKQSIAQYLGSVLSVGKYRHCIEEEHQLDRLIEKGVVCFDCQKIKELSLTGGHCQTCRWSERS